MNNKIKLVDVYMASLWRQGHIVKTVKSLLSNPEVGMITVSCNNYNNKQWEFVNDELNNPKVILYRTNNEKRSNEKMRFIGDGSNYYICFADDDLIYPPNYLKKLIDGCEKYNAHVSLHGRIFKSGIISSYYSDVTAVYHALGTVANDIFVDIVSNNGSLFKRKFHDDLDTWYDFASTISMDDIYVNFFAKKKGIKRVVLAHEKGYLIHKELLPEDDYVFEKHKFNDKIQTDFINNHFNTI